MEYNFWFIVFWFVLSLLLSLLLLFASYLIMSKQASVDKFSPYECGFEPFEDVRSTFDVRFYLVSILFIIFDLEILFLFPWSIVLRSLGFFGLCSMYFFLFVLTVGFYYEWFKGALDWE